MSKKCFLARSDEFFNGASGEYYHINIRKLLADDSAHFGKGVGLEHRLSAA